MPENTSETIKKPIFDRLIQTYDQEIINNPDWLSVSDIQKVIGMGIELYAIKLKQVIGKKNTPRLMDLPWFISQNKTFMLT